MQLVDIVSILLRRWKHVLVSKLQATSNWSDLVSELDKYETPPIIPGYEFKMVTYLPRSGQDLPGVCAEPFKTRAGTFLCSTMEELVSNGQLWERAVLRQLSSYEVG